MRRFLEQKKYYLALMAIMLLFECIVNPTGEFPLNDDWSYAKPVKDWHETGVYNIGSWPAMTLFTHLLWGLLFVKTFGFSFLVLRVSTLISSFAGLCAMLALGQRISSSRSVGFVMALTLLLNPIYFNLSNTYMTDVNFSTLFILGCYGAYRFFERPGPLTFTMVMLVSVLLVFLRQFGFVLPLAFFVSLLLQKRWVYALFTGAGLMLIMYGLTVYENFLRTVLPPDASYKYASDNHFMSREFFDLFFTNLKYHYLNSVMHGLIYTLPFGIIWLASAARTLVAKWALVSLVLVLGLSYWLLQNETFPLGNVFIDFDLGPETFFESMCEESVRDVEHNVSPLFEKIMVWGVKPIFAGLSLFILVLAFRKAGKVHIVSVLKNGQTQFFLAIGFLYSLMLLSFNFYFDRYNIPVIIIALILLAYLNRIFEPKFLWALPLMLLLVWVSVFGTRDYLSWNRKRWEAYNYLIKQEGISPDKINAGFEPNCWNDGKGKVWYAYYSLKSYDYLIQYFREPGFKPYKEFPFQRFFPYRTDKVIIFERDSLQLRNPDPAAGNK